VVLVNQTGSSLLPGVVRTHAPVGQTPVMHAPLSRDHLSALGGAHRIHLEQFPSYAPELNPAEGIWNYLKWVELKNRCCQSISYLYYELCKAKERLRHKTKVILGCIKQPGFY
jgi:transposase